MLQLSPTCYVCPACGRAVDVLVPVGEAPRCARCDRLMKPPLRLAIGATRRREGVAPSEATAEPQAVPAAGGGPERPAKPAPPAPQQLGLFSGGQ
jgi:DNA-directed RNA polymerase subunit RPC12/RpoP